MHTKKISAILASAIITLSTGARISAQEYTIPDIDSDFKSYMDYRCITSELSPQYKLQQYAWTDENGLRRKDDYYLVALGTYYSDTIGDCFLITLDTGDSFKAMVGDVKDDKDTDSTNRYRPMEYGKGNIVEFIVDTKSLDSFTRKMGTVSVIEGFGGNIQSIESIDYEEGCKN